MTLNRQVDWKKEAHHALQHSFNTSHNVYSVKLLAWLRRLLRRLRPLPLILPAFALAGCNTLTPTERHTVEAVSLAIIVGSVAASLDHEHAQHAAERAHIHAVIGPQLPTGEIP